MKKEELKNGSKVRNLNRKVEGYVMAWYPTNDTPQRTMVCVGGEGSDRCQNVFVDDLELVTE